MSLLSRRFAQGAVLLLAGVGFPAYAASDDEQRPRPGADMLARPCFACHSDREPSVIPKLRGGPETRFIARMREFRDRRTDSVMHRIAKGYRDEDYQQLARYFRQLDQAPPR
ncbi:MAG: hypothetical protein MUF20_08690 [Methylotetracoccus sp.]|nr:hypothetical protein [Methylotetracoccus sp.]